MIHVACNIDANYIRHCAVTLVSMFENNRDERFTIYIVYKGVCPADEEALVSLVSGYGHEVHFYSPDERLLEGFEIRKFKRRISLATYYRCILAELLPESVSRVLYLDCDIVVTGGIAAFWNTPLDGVGVAAVEDVGAHEAERYDVLQYPAELSYFNAGVLLINLDFWREMRMGEACAEYYRKYPERILFNDQDLLNSLLCRHKVLVGLEWNVQDGFYRRPKAMTPEWKAKYADALLRPTILHYTNRKPWLYDCSHPMRGEYFRYLALTPWGKSDDVRHRPVEQIKRMLRFLPFTLGLRKPKYVDIKHLPRA